MRSLFSAAGRNDPDRGLSGWLGESETACVGVRCGGVLADRQSFRGPVFRFALRKENRIRTAISDTVFDTNTAPVDGRRRDALAESDSETGTEGRR